MRGWCSLKSIISIIKYYNNEIGRELATGCVTVVGHDAVAGRDVGNLYLNSCFCREKVEKPISACRESLPKQLFSPGKGRDSKPHLPEIST